MAPLGLPRLLLAKFALGTAPCRSASPPGLIVLSCRMLDARRGTGRSTSPRAIAVMAFTLNGLAIGLGALYPNLKEDNPSKIVSGFGGTFCLVASFLYIVASVVLLAVSSPWTRYGEPSSSSVLPGWMAFALLSALVGWLPLRLSLRRVGQFEM